ncbi:class I SAM-dependent methyltransferase [Pseudobutyrivibrio sp.]|uniref:class I SAM-dependent methyltransferase n=1 Tax=Pseudobutyrivibrio sp. TaxID=2014367 RepID=UPI001B3F13B7|nr:class I SAM-dependent methyltransferase [Pseudobutyrivibrio sp.]MBP3262727.1 methyltransferase domain-containing protein [Pseudobutyrivibrio sp.]
MKKKKDIGLEYINKLGINYERTIKAIEEKTRNKYGKDKGQQLINSLCEANNKSIDYMEYNRILASQENFANTWQGSVDANFVRAACNYIYSNKDQFGDNILEVGCGFGFLTCFLSQLFPDKQITSIDIDKSCIKVAKENTERLGCQNVSFIVGDVNTISSTFDTIFISRVVHEVAEYNAKFNFNENPFLIMDNVSERLNPFTDSIIKKLSYDGVIISIDKTYRNPLYLAWLKSLSNSNYFLDIDTHTVIEVPLSGLPNNAIFMAGVYKRDISTQDVINTYFSVCSKNLNYSSEHLEGDEAYLYFWNSKPELIKGVSAKTQNTDGMTITVTFLLAFSEINHSYIEYYFYDADAKVAILPQELFTKEEALSQYNDDYSNFFQTPNKHHFHDIAELSTLNRMIFD